MANISVSILDAGTLLHLHQPGEAVEKGTDTLLEEAGTTKARSKTCRPRRSNITRLRCNGWWMRMLGARLEAN
jgi:hypothetical protein